MKKIINGKRYDTETAKYITEWESGYPSDFSYFCETLYIKRSGEYFIHGEGNAASRYAESAGMNTWRSGERIIPLSYEDARAWGEEHMDADEYEAEFGKVAEDDGNVMVSVRVNAAAKAMLDRFCARTGRAKGEVVESLLATLEV